MNIFIHEKFPIYGILIKFTKCFYLCGGPLIKGRLESVEWNSGMERWNGTVEWNGGMERWNGIVEWINKIGIPKQHLQ